MLPALCCAIHLMRVPFSLFLHLIPKSKHLTLQTSLTSPNSSFLILPNCFWDLQLQQCHFCLVQLLPSYTVNDYGLTPTAFLTVTDSTFFFLLVPTAEPRTAQSRFTNQPDLGRHSPQRRTTNSEFFGKRVQPTKPSASQWVAKLGLWAFAFKTLCAQQRVLENGPGKKIPLCCKLKSSRGLPQGNNGWRSSQGKSGAPQPALPLGCGE